MKNSVMLEVYSELGAKTEMQKMVCNELVYLVLVEPSNGVSIKSYEKREELRKELYGNNFGSLEEKVLRLTDSWSNDLADALQNKLKVNGVFERLFTLLKGKEVISGVVLP